MHQIFHRGIKIQLNASFVIGEITLGEDTGNIFNEMIGRGNNFVIGEITLGEDMVSNL
jgi:hypothetical protein